MPFPSLPVTYRVVWESENVCSGTQRSELEINGLSVAFKPNFTGETHYNGVTVGNGRIMLPAFEVDSLCPDICDDSVIKPNLTYQDGQLKGTINTYCGSVDPELEYLVTPLISIKIDSIDTGVGVGTGGSVSWGASENSSVGSH